MEQVPAEEVDHENDPFCLKMMGMGGAGLVNGMKDFEEFVLLLESEEWKTRGEDGLPLMDAKGKNKRGKNKPAAIEDIKPAEQNEQLLALEDEHGDEAEEHVPGEVSFVASEKQELHSKSKKKDKNGTAAVFTASNKKKKAGEQGASSSYNWDFIPQKKTDRSYL